MSSKITVYLGRLLLGILVCFSLIPLTKQVILQYDINDDHSYNIIVQ